MPKLSAKSIQVLKTEFSALLRANLAETSERMREVVSKKIILNSDDLFRILPRYEAHPEERMFLGPLLYPVAREITDEIYAKLLNAKFTNNDTIVFTAGGSATGKSSILRSAGSNPGVDFIVDTTFSNAVRALAQVDRALASGRKVEIYYVFRDFRDSVIGMIERALDRESGRVVPIDDMARTHFGAQRAVLAAMERYADNPCVSIILRANKAGKLRSFGEREFAKLLHPSVDSLEALGQTVLDEFRHDERSKRSSGDKNYHAGGKSLHFSEAFYEAAQSQAQGRRKSSSKSDARAISKGGKESEAARSSAPEAPSG